MNDSLRVKGGEISVVHIKQVDWIERQSVATNTRTNRLSFHLLLLQRGSVLSNSQRPIQVILYISESES